MLADIGAWLLIGVLLAAAVTAFLPETFFEQYLHNEWISMLVMLAAGVPLYVCATSSTPIAASLALKGLSPGAALVFLLASPATNAATITVVAKTLGRRAAGAYVGSIVLCSLALGWLVNRVYGWLGLDISAWIGGAEADTVNWFTALCAVALLVLVARALLPRGGGHDHTHDHDHDHGPGHAHGAADAGCSCCGSGAPAPGSITGADFKVK